MRRYALLCFVALFGSTMTSASKAETHTTQKIGAWSAFEGTDVEGVSVCGVLNAGVDGRVFLIKRWANDPSLKIQIYKSNWQIPKDQSVRVELEFDSRGAWSAKAAALPPDGLSVRIPEDKTEEFLREFALADKVFVRFLEGSEGAWSGGLGGSAKMTFLLADCVSRLEPSGSAQPRGATQPFSPPATQPFAPPATQPFVRDDRKL
jgi:hypothetical protein